MSMDEPVDADDVVVPRRLADQAYEVLRNRVLARRLLPGDRLSVPRLAADLGLSRSPVREAVQRLVAEGLGVEQVHRGAVVADLTLDDLAQVYAVREVLEGLAARLAATRKADDLVADLRTLVAEHADAVASGSEADVIRADLRFHGRILEASGNPSLQSALGPILGRVQIAMLAGDLQAWPKAAVTEHRRILSAIAAGDEARAEAAAREHVVLVRDRLHRRLSG